MGDKRLQQKVVAKYSEYLKTKVRNDSIDLIPHHTLKPFSLQQVEGRSLQTEQPEVTITYLYEPYPVEGCYNGGQLINQT